MTATRTAADEAWRGGRLVDARRGYTEILARAPGDWRASCQLAWLDAAFGRLAVDDARALSRPDLSTDAQDVVRALVAAAEGRAPLSGAELDWDIEALRSAGASANEDWWLAKGRAAWEVGLYGLAAVCFDEARDRWDLLYDDPPRWAQGTLTQADHHLRAIATALP